MLFKCLKIPIIGYCVKCGKRISLQHSIIQNLKLMKKQSIWVFTALSLFYLVSCTQDADNLISEKNELKEEIVSENNLDELLAISSSPQRSKDEALAIARQFSTTSTVLIPWQNLSSPMTSR